MKKYHSYPNNVKIPVSLMDIFLYLCSCINNCGELQPGTNLTASSLSDSQKTAIAENFGDYLRTGWAFGSCGNDVVILYAQDLNKVYLLFL